MGIQPEEIPVIPSTPEIIPPKEPIGPGWPSHTPEVIPEGEPIPGLAPEEVPAPPKEIIRSKLTDYDCK